MTMWIVSDDPRLRLFDGHADIAGAHHSRMMRTAPVGGVGANPISLSAQCGKGSLERGRPRFLSADPQDVGTVSAEHGSSAPVIPVMPRVAVCASTASMSARIRHEWSNPQWTARAYPCGLPAHAFVAQPVEAMRQGRIQSGFESRRKHWRKCGRQRRPYGS